MEAVFQDCIAEVKRDGRTVLLSSHILAEVEALCDRLSIIRAGRTVQSGTLEDLRHLTRTSVTAQTLRPADEITALPGVQNVSLDDGRVSFDVESDHLDGAIVYLSSLGVQSLVSHPPTLAQLFLGQYGDDLQTVAS